MAIGRDELKKAVRLLQDGDWRAAHEILQRDEASALCCWAHGIVHIMEGDLPNARYWYAQAKRAFPADASARQEIEALEAALRAAK
jgi:hypothetical protein